MFYLIFFTYYDIRFKVTYFKFETFGIEVEIKSKEKIKKIKRINKKEKTTNEG